MADEVIWNPNRSMNFIASKYLASYIYRGKSKYNHSRKDWLTVYHIRVQLKDVTLSTPTKWPGLWYATYKREEEAIKGLAQLAEELVRAGVIEVTENKSDNRFDHVELQEGDDG